MLLSIACDDTGGDVVVDDDGELLFCLSYGEANLFDGDITVDNFSFTFFHSESRVMLLFY